MRRDKFKVVDSRSNGAYSLCIKLTSNPVEVEIENYYHKYSIGDILLIEYNECNKANGLTIGTVILDSNIESAQEHWLRTHHGDWSIETVQWPEHARNSMMNRISQKFEPFNFNVIQPTEEKEMQNHLVELLAKNFYTIGINFENSSKSYTYKVALGTELEVEDQVIVDTTSGLTIVNVNRVDEDASGIDLSLDVKYKFIVQKLDTTEYDKLCEKDKAISKVIAQGAAEKARRELIESYTGDLNDEQIKALEDCGVSADAVKRLD